MPKSPVLAGKTVIKNLAGAAILSLDKKAVM